MPPTVPPAAMIEHRRAVEAGEEFYVDPDTGYLVMTAPTLKGAASAAGAGDRHCPYPVEEQRRAGRPDA